jgi:hypothetical protein
MAIVAGSLSFFTIRSMALFVIVTDMADFPIDTARRQNV